MTNSNPSSASEIGKAVTDRRHKPNRTMKNTIQNRLKQLERERGIRILYACESGSRAWGFASPDSDYDVRFIYVHAPEWYLSIHNRDETIELPLEGELDIAGWDLRKALRLFAKSNGALLEWLHSPTVYCENDEIVPVWRSLVPDVVSPKSLAHHYLGQCKRIWLGSLQTDLVRAKHYLYALRSLLSAKWVLECRSVPPVEFARLVEQSKLSPAVIEAIAVLVASKGSGNEHLVIDLDPVLHPFIEMQLAALDEIARQMGAFAPESELVDAFLQGIVSDGMTVHCGCGDREETPALCS